MNEQEKIQIKFIRTASIDELIALYREAGWWDESGADNLQFLHDIVRNSALFVGAFMDHTMVGMGRALSDLASDAYIQDVTVLKEFRGRGIGKKIIQALIGRLKEQGVDWIGLIGEPGTLDFYKKLGFSRLKGYIPLKLKD